MMKMTGCFRLFFLAFLAAVPTSAFAAMPGATVVEGVMLSAAGGPAADGTYDITFSVFAAAKGGKAAWSEGPVKVDVKSGRFTHRLGVAKAIDAKKLAALGAQWLEIKVGSDPALPRARLNAVIFALYAKTANSLQCSGCLTGKNIAGGSIGPSQVNFSYAASADGIKGGDAKVARALKCTGCVSVKHMKFDGAINMGANALVAGKLTSNSDVVAKGTVAAKQFVGDGSKLTGIKSAAGKCAKEGEVVKGINADGSLICVAGGLPADGLSQVSNGQLSTQFSDPIHGGKNKAVPDNNPDGLLDVIKFPDIGIAQNIEVNVHVSNSDTADLALFLFPPNAPKLPAERKSIIKNFPSKPSIDANVYPHYVLHMKTLFNKANKTVINTTYPTKTKTLTGDIHKDWLNKNIKGDWRLLIIDTAFLNNKTDGKLVSWNITVKTLSNKQVNVTGTAFVGGKLWGKYQGSGNPGGDLQVGGGIKLGHTAAACAKANLGTLRWDPKWGLQACQANVPKSGAMKYAWAAATARTIIWSGGCKSHSRGSGWATYCLDGTDWETAVSAGYIKVSGTTVTTNVSGYYQFSVYADQHGCGSKRLQMFVDGASRAYNHNDENYSHRWGHTRMTQVFPMKSGSTWYVRFHADGCNPYRWHSWNTSGNHSRVQVRYLGPLQ